MFAQRLGVQQATISKYEHGRVSPSRSAVMLLLPLAETPDERLAIVAALGDLPTQVRELERELDAKLGEAQALVDQDRAELESTQRVRSAFLDLAARVARSTSVPTGLLSILDIWLTHRHEPGVRDALDNAASSFREDVGTILARKRLSTYRKSIDSSRHVEKAIMSRCPTTKKWFNTGSRMSQADFDSSDFGVWDVWCPHCKMSHRFNKAQSKLQ